MIHSLWYKQETISIKQLSDFAESLRFTFDEQREMCR